MTQAHTEKNPGLSLLALKAHYCYSYSSSYYYYYYYYSPTQTENYHEIELENYKNLISIRSVWSCAERFRFVYTQAETTIG